MSVRLRYAYLGEGEDKEPCMLLTRTAFAQNYAFAIGLSSAHMYTDDAYLVTQAMKCTEVLRMHPATRGEIMGICDKIINGLEQLIKTVPYEHDDSKKQYIGEGRATIGNETIEFLV